MSKVTSKLQVTLPKALAERFGIRPGDEVELEAMEGAIRILVPARAVPLDREERLHLFDRATARQRKREARRGPVSPAKDRGWKREDLYDRGVPR
jgi:AbrB family looped-hinge helix DNA binding protein